VARLTKGAYCAFDAGSIAQLREFLRAVCAFATGGLTALADLRTDSARKLRLTWRDEHTLVIGENDARRIVTTQIQGDLRCFICGDADGEQYGLEEAPDGGGFVVYKDQRRKDSKS